MIDVITNVFRFPRSITNVNTFGNRLRYARTLRKLTQAELARLCGLSQGAIGNYEADSRRNAKEIFRIADALDVSASWLATGSGPMEVQAASRLAEHTLRAPDLMSWPFPGIDPARIWALSAEQRQQISNALSSMLALIENNDADSPA